jgi:hypothetical protein
MASVDFQVALDGVPEFITAAVEQLSSSLGEADPLVESGRRAIAALGAIPADAVLVTEATVAAAMQRAWPLRRNTPTGMALSAALLIAALREER